MSQEYEVTWNNNEERISINCELSDYAITLTTEPKHFSKLADLVDIIYRMESDTDFDSKKIAYFKARSFKDESKITVQSTSKAFLGCRQTDVGLKQFMVAIKDYGLDLSAPSVGCTELRKMA